MDQRKRIDELVEKLNEASHAYYTQGVEIITNYEYDEMYDELLALEDETGYIRDDSPSINVGFETAAGLPKIVHEIKMLSLNKTKDREELNLFRVLPEATAQRAKSSRQMFLHAAMFLRASLIKAG